MVGLASRLTTHMITVPLGHSLTTTDNPHTVLYGTLVKLVLGSVNQVMWQLTYSTFSEAIENANVN